MYIGKRSIIINRDLPSVYKMAETYPGFVNFFLQGSRILKSDDRELRVEVHSRLLFFKTSWRGEGVKRNCRFIRFRQTQGLLKGLIARWSFLPTEAGVTKVRIMTHFKKLWFTPIGERYFGKYIVEITTQKILNALKIKSENMMGSNENS